ncbi:MAG: phosphatidate cytidylyltransferase [Clostridia bacterium]|nr:phosphatidate cytidylyltransferase [Clostridia bacterium]
MKTRTKTAAIIIAIVLVALASRLLYVGLFDIFMGFVAITGCLEICKLFNSKQKHHCTLISALYPVFFYVAFTVCMLCDASVLWYVLSQVILLVVLLLIAFLVKIKLGVKLASKYVLNTLLIVLYPGLFFCSFFVINNLEMILGLELSYVQLSYTMLALIFLISSVTDTFAYIFGSLIRGPKLAPKISPNKSISGAVFGVIGGILAGLLVYGLCCWIAPFSDIMIVQLGLKLWHFILFGAVGSIIGQAGDLFESWIKRRFEVKDTGTLFPGHGGMMDRVDSHIMIALAVLVCFLIIL